MYLENAKKKDTVTKKVLEYIENENDPNLVSYKYIQNEVFKIIKMPGGMLFVQKREKITPSDY